jgi:hypothetical protein
MVSLTIKFRVMQNIIKSIFHSLIVWSRLIRRDSKRPFSLGPFNKVFSWWNGFLPESYVLYDLASNRRTDYLSDYARLNRAPSINGVFSVLLDSKLIFAYFFKHCDIIDKPEFYIKNGRFIDFNSGQVVKASALDSVLMPGDYVVKPAGGGGGQGILFLQFENNTWANFNKCYTSHELAELHPNGELLIYKKIIQTGFAHEIFPRSLNTIRILTMIDPTDSTPFIAAAVMRTGVSQSGSVDNWSSGGLSIYVNPNNGVMGKGVSFPKHANLTWCKSHPDTGFHFYNMMIPNWKDMSNQILTMSQELSIVPYIAWDIVPMRQGFKVLEANSNSDVNLLQIHKPLLAHTKTINFYKHYNVL